MKEQHYFSRKQYSPEKPVQFEWNFCNNKFIFISPSGVFSKGSIDTGTKVLLLAISNSLVKEDSEILDLGCGYGVVGIVAKKIFPNSKITLTDINERAIKYAKINSKKNNVDIIVIQGDMYESVKEKKFDIILINPPQTAGKKVCFSMIEQAKQHLKKNGKLFVVARHQKGGKSFEEKMKNVFQNVKTVEIKSGFRVYMSSVE